MEQLNQPILNCFDSYFGNPEVGKEYLFIADVEKWIRANSNEIINQINKGLRYESSTKKIAEGLGYTVLEADRLTPRPEPYICERFTLLPRIGDCMVYLRRGNMGRPTHYSELGNDWMLNELDAYIEERFKVYIAKVRDNLKREKQTAGRELNRLQREMEEATSRMEALEHLA